ncbi:hypothetical protein C8F04DRAFT_1137093 [Mycena alexandri]|uniref:C3H1-type domain-containing protein n=1 Tax=Mycena alexandri TaxID=1745969 RepID=A0AAD6SAH7_9AGAR|nr:hypothetical protein C8F04DRAFT_1137093 [Mycena alexandri]
MTQPATQSLKKPHPKKRHTKPCRYFQTGSCPHAAQEDCDFAHIFGDQPVSLPPPKQCRYYLQGNCTNGIWCQYRHGDSSAGSDEVSLLKDYQNVNSLSGRELGIRSPSIQVRPAIGIVPPAVYIPNPSHFNGMYVGSTPWTYPSDVHSPLEFTPPSHLLPHGAILSPANSIESIDIDNSTPPSSSSSPTSSVSDDGVFLPTENFGQYYSKSYFGPNEPQSHGVAHLGPAYEEPFIHPYSQHQPLSVVTAPYAMAPLYEIFSPKSQPSSAGFYSTERFPPRSPINRQKLASYRTKPCRYFKPGSVCPNGSTCTFLHVNPNGIDSPPSPEPVKLQHGLPSKPLSTKEENTRKGYFPISWRVIGGGVLVGGIKESSLSDDDESELSADSLDGRSDSLLRILEIEIPSAPASAVDFPSSESNADTDDSMTPTTLHTRQRASSIPSTPVSTHVDHLRLFSAESPGGL